MQRFSIVNSAIVKLAKLDTEAIKIQGEKPQKTEHHPLQPLTPEPNSLIFWRESIHVITLGMSEAIFEFPIWDRDMGPTPSPR